MRPDQYPPQEPLPEVGQRYALALAAKPQPANGVETVWGNSPYQSVTLYPAANPDGRVLVAIHGGGWTCGYKEWMAFMAPAFNGQGITFASLGYRLAPVHLFPAGLDDCRRGLGLIAEQVEAFGGQPHNIFVGGHSAGGHYASLLTLDAKTGVRGCLSISGVYWFGEGSGLKIRPRFLDTEAAEKTASPIFRVRRDPGALPFLLAHGDRDFPHLVMQAERMEQALIDQAVPVERLVLADSDHFDAHLNSCGPDSIWLARALDFMARYAA